MRPEEFATGFAQVRSGDGPPAIDALMRLYKVVVLNEQQTLTCNQVQGC